MSRTEYLRQDAARAARPVSVADLQRFSSRFEGLGDARAHAPRLVVNPDAEAAGWLLDKSALVRLGASADAEAWANRIECGLVHITTVTLLEFGCSARNAAEQQAGYAEPPIASMPVEYASPASEDRAVQVLSMLASAEAIARRPSLTC